MEELGSGQSAPIVVYDEGAAHVPLVVVKARALKEVSEPEDKVALPSVSADVEIPPLVSVVKPSVKIAACTVPVVDSESEARETMPEVEVSVPPFNTRLHQKRQNKQV